MEGFLLLDFPALVNAAIFSREKIRLNFQNFHISLAGFPFQSLRMFQENHGLGKMLYRRMRTRLTRQSVTDPFCLNFLPKNKFNEWKDVNVNTVFKIEHFLLKLDQRKREGVKFSQGSLIFSFYWFLKQLLFCLFCNNIGHYDYSYHLNLVLEVI